MATDPGPSLSFQKKHLQALELCCRVCGPQVDNKAKLSQNKSHNAKLLLQVFNIDITRDTVLHPKYICGNCFNVNRSFLKCNRNKRLIENLKSSLTIVKYEFPENCEGSCPVCKPGHQVDTVGDGGGDVRGAKPSPFQYSISAALSAQSPQSVSRKDSFPATSPVIVSKTPNDQSEGREIIIGTDPRSIPGSQFIDPHLAAAFKCSICSIDNISRIPLTPLKSANCVHFFCLLCIQNWRSSEYVNSSSCPVQSCRAPLGQEELHGPTGLLGDIHLNLSLHCKYIQNGCDTNLHIGDYSSHLRTCRFRIKKGHPQKKSIGLLEKNDNRRKRLEPMREDFFEMCARGNIFS